MLIKLSPALLSLNFNNTYGLETQVFQLSYLDNERYSHTKKSISPPLTSYIDVVPNRKSGRQSLLNHLCFKHINIKLEARINLTPLGLSKQKVVFGTHRHTPTTIL
jgi:hypothetical protein